jgi:endo-alpha-1,4-polygalactosaminidase (GH114 family)
MKTLLADTLLDPKKTAELLKRTQNISNVEKLLSNKAAQKLPSSVITAILLNRKQDNEK